MRTYKVEVKYVYKGAYYVKADSKKEAIEIVQKGCGAVGNKPQTTDSRVEDWDFDVHPKQEIVYE